jgi:diamine N-acetyltransferase
MSVILRPLTQENFRDVFFLEITDEERNHSQLDTMEEILEEIISDRERNGVVIYSDDSVVGFADYGFVPSEQAYQILHFMIDQNHRRRGYGEQGLRLLITELCQKPDCERIGISYMSFNDTGAIELYEKVGFEELPTKDDTHGTRFAVYLCGEGE